MNKPMEKMTCIEEIKIAQKHVLMPALMLNVIDNTRLQCIDECVVCMDMVV